MRLGWDRWNFLTVVKCPVCRETTTRIDDPRSHQMGFWLGITSWWHDVYLTSAHCSHPQLVRDHLNWAPTITSVWFPLILAHRSCVISWIKHLAILILFLLSPTARRAVASVLFPDLNADHINVILPILTHRKCVVSWSEHRQPCWSHFRPCSLTGCVSPELRTNSLVHLIFFNRQSVVSWIEYRELCRSDFCPFSPTGRALSAEWSTHSDDDLISALSHPQIVSRLPKWAPIVIVELIPISRLQDVCYPSKWTPTAILIWFLYSYSQEVGRLLNLAPGVTLVSCLPVLTHRSCVVTWIEHPQPWWPDFHLFSPAGCMLSP